MNIEDNLDKGSMTNIEALEYVLDMAKQNSINEWMVMYVKPELLPEYTTQQKAMKKAVCFLRNLKFLSNTL